MAFRDYTHDLVGIEIDRVVRRREDVVPPPTEDRPWPRSKKIFSGDLRKAALDILARDLHRCHNLHGISAPHDLEFVLGHPQFATSPTMPHLRKIDSMTQRLPGNVRLGCAP